MSFFHPIHSTGHNTANSRVHAQATLTSPGHGTGLKNLSIVKSLTGRAGQNISVGLSILANVIGGSLMLCGLLFLPQIIAGLLA